MTLRLRRRARTVILEMLDEKDSGGKPPNRSQSVVERPDYAELALELMLAGARLVDPSSRLARRYSRLFRVPLYSL